MKRFLLILLLLSQSVYADLDQAVAYAKAGDVRKGQIELYNISQRALAMYLYTSLTHQTKFGLNYPLGLY